MDANRMTLLFFAISGLDLLDALDSVEQQRDAIIEWIYSMQVTPASGTGAGKPAAGAAGFRGSNYLGLPFSPSGVVLPLSADDAAQGAEPHVLGHITMTYTALATLIILGDDLSRVARGPIIEAIRHLQLESGCCSATAYGSENDMRFLYCACVISSMLDDVSLDWAVLVVEVVVVAEGGSG